MEEQQPNADHCEINEGNVTGALVTLSNHASPRYHIADVEVVVGDVVEDERARIAHEAEDHRQAPGQRPSEKNQTPWVRVPTAAAVLIEHAEKNGGGAQTKKKRTNQTGDQAETAG